MSTILDRIARALGYERVRVPLRDPDLGLGYGIAWRRLRGASGPSARSGRGRHG
jgi:hypothetical protein